MLKIINSFAKDESGATAIEYGLIAALVALAGVAAFTTLGASITSIFGDISTALDAA